MHALTVRLQDGTSLSHDLRDGQSVIIGHTRLADFVVDDPAVSRRHLRVVEDDGVLYVEDLRSTNGTYLDTERLEPGRLYPLTTDQAVYLGASLLTVSAEQPWEMTRVGGPTHKPKFVAVLYTDIVQSTAMTAKVGQDRNFQLMEWHNAMFRERFKKFGGRETKYTGDGFEGVFTSVNDALSCAASCQRNLARRNHEDATGLVVEVRMGINGGEAPASGRRVYGMPLILAARVMSEATAAQILVPAHVLGIVAGSLWKFNAVGERRLKGIDAPMPLFEVLWHADPNLQSPTGLVAASGQNGIDRGQAVPAPPRERRKATAPIE